VKCVAFLEIEGFGDIGEPAHAYLQHHNISYTKFTYMPTNIIVIEPAMPVYRCSYQYKLLFSYLT
jgi:hypothetical protein